MPESSLIVPTIPPMLKVNEVTDCLWIAPAATCSLIQRGNMPGAKVSRFWCSSKENVTHWSVEYSQMTKCNEETIS